MPRRVAFLWHMHQPSYRRPSDGEIVMPWVRLHAVKDYSDMAYVHELVPEARATINFVPGLLDQLEACLQPGYERRERTLRLMLTPASALSAAQRAQLYETFFSLPQHTMIAPHPRYAALHRKASAGQPFDTAELRDLQIWFNLAWCGVVARQHPVIASLLSRGANFDEADKMALWLAQRDVISQVVPRWRRLKEQGKVALSATPMYHPIAPLLMDSHWAREADPDSPLPNRRFQFPADAQHHIARGVQTHERHFGVAPTGMWPAEGALCDPAVALFADAGVRWLATDEAVLSKSAVASQAHDRDQVFEQAVAAGAEVKRPMADQFYGDRSGTVEDPFGHQWTIGTHIEDLTNEQIEERMAAWAAEQAG